VDKLFGAVFLKPPTIRTRSNWASQDGLSQAQIEYAANDAYALIWCYKKLMTIMNPHVERKLLQQDVDVGLRVVVYNQSWKSWIGMGTIVDQPTTIR
jgi:ribonuclease D